LSEAFRPLAQIGGPRPDGALPLAGGPCWFTHAALHSRDAPVRILAGAEVPAEARDRLTAPRAPVAGLDMAGPAVMGIVNATPDSFSDGGDHHDADTAIAAAREMIDAGADMLDIGGESTRPGAETIAPETEIGRTRPVIEGIRRHSAIPLSIDTRKAAVAAAALDAGADMVNDVAALTFDPALAPLCADRAVPVCVMHAQGDPATMQDDPRYDDVLLDVHDFLAARIAALETAGIPRDRIVVDPGIGFGKTVDHNLALLRGIAIFHDLGCPILLGVSRKGFIGRIGQAPDPRRRFAGSIALGVAGWAQGVQILRVHDTAQTVQALRLWRAAHM
jgi:dihydropteroate synthase